MIAPEVSDRLATVILGATRARGFALVVFFDNDGSLPETAHHCEALVGNADPQTAATMLNEIADTYYQEIAASPRVG